MTTVGFLSVSSIAILLLVGTQGTLHVTELALRYQASEHERKRTTRCEFHGGCYWTARLLLRFPLVPTMVMIMLQFTIIPSLFRIVCYIMLSLWSCYCDGKSAPRCEYINAFKGTQLSMSTHVCDCKRTSFSKKRRNCFRDCVFFSLIPIQRFLYIVHRSLIL